MKKTEQMTVTIDIPGRVKGGLDTLAVALCLTNLRDGEEAPNRSSMARILLEVGMANVTDFSAWLSEYKNDPEQELYRFTFQASDQFIERLERCATYCKLTRAEEGKRVPNLTQVVRRLMEFVLSRRDLIEYWFEERIREARNV